MMPNQTTGPAGVTPAAIEPRPRTTAAAPEATTGAATLPTTGGPASTATATARPGSTSGPNPSPRPSAAPKPRPDPRPMRLGIGAGAIAAITVMIGGMVRVPVSDPTADAQDTVTAAAPVTREVRIEKRVRYVQLKRGEKAPPGAKVIDAAQPTPRVVVTRIQQQQPAKVKVRKVAKSRQSGR